MTIVGFLAELRKRHEHRWANRRVSEYIDGELTPAQCRRLRHHADECEECGPLLRALTVIVPELRLLHTAPRRSITPGMIARLRAETPLPDGGAS